MSRMMGTRSSIGGGIIGGGIACAGGRKNRHRPEAPRGFPVLRLPLLLAVLLCGNCPHGAAAREATGNAGEGDRGQSMQNQDQWVLDEADKNDESFEAPPGNAWEHRTREEEATTQYDLTTAAPTVATATWWRQRRGGGAGGVGGVGLSGVSMLCGVGGVGGVGFRGEGGVVAVADGGLRHLLLPRRSLGCRATPGWP